MYWQKAQINYQTGYYKKALISTEKCLNIVNKNKPPSFKNYPNYSNDKRLIFIAGLPRSGTTLTHQILAAHSKVHGAGEKNTAGGEYRCVGRDHSHADRDGQQVRARQEAH